MSERNDRLIVERAEQLWRPETRRGFLRMLGLGGTIVLLPSVFAACDDDDDITGPPGGGVELDLSDDTGILNYAYALEQLEAAFYTAVVGSAAFGGLNANEKEVLTDLRNHEVVHREFLAQVLGDAALGDLELDQATVDAAIASRDSIFLTAEKFEDLGVAAYNGAGKYLESATNLLVAGKIVSVEARHAAAIRDIRDTGASAGRRFAGDDVVLATGAFAGLDVKLEPAAVLTRVEATNFVETTIEVTGDPRGGRPGTPDAAPPTNP